MRSIEVNKALKTLSSPPIAQGRTAEVFLWDDRHILKLYRDWCPPDWIDYEARIARARLVSWLTALPLLGPYLARINRQGRVRHPPYR